MEMDQMPRCPHCGKWNLLMRRTIHGAWYVSCEACGLGGPHGTSPYDAMRIWRNIPKQGAKHGQRKAKK